MVAKLKALFGFHRKTSEILSSFRKTHDELLGTAARSSVLATRYAERSAEAQQEAHAAARAAEKIGALIA